MRRIAGVSLSAGNVEQKRRTKMDTLVGGEQPGWMQSAESRINALMRNDIKRSVYDRLVNAAITVAISVAIALRDHWGMR